MLRYTGFIALLLLVVDLLRALSLDTLLPLLAVGYFVLKIGRPVRRPLR